MFEFVQWKSNSLRNSESEYNWKLFRHCSPFKLHSDSKFAREREFRWLVELLVGQRVWTFQEPLNSVNRTRKVKFDKLETWWSLDFWEETNLLLVRDSFQESRKDDTRWWPRQKSDASLQRERDISTEKYNGNFEWKKLKMLKRESTLALYLSVCLPWNFKL